MRLGLISDTHDNEARTRVALEVFARKDVDAILHMGDLSTRAMLPLLDGWTVWIAEGNTDEDPAAIVAAARLVGGDIAYADVHELEFDGLRVGVIHGDDEARLQGMIASGAFGLVCHGHTHRFRDERLGPTRVINPGAVHRSAEPSVCTVDTGTKALERLLL